MLLDLLSQEIGPKCGQIAARAPENLFVFRLGLLLLLNNNLIHDIELILVVHAFLMVLFEDSRAFFLFR